MAREAEFTKTFKNTLATHLGDVFRRVVPCEMGLETKPFPNWKGIPDFWILDLETPGLWIFEVEHHSNNVQIMRNILQVAKYQEGRSRQERFRIALVHVISERALITRQVREIIEDIDSLDDLVEYRVHRYDPTQGTAEETAARVLKELKPKIAEIFDWMQS